MPEVQTNGPRLSYLGVAGTLAVSLLLISATRAVGSVTIGQLAPDPVPYCSDQFDYLQPTVISGNGYVVPATGTITSWSTAAASGANRQMAMKIFRKVGNPTINTYQVIGHDGPRLLTPTTVNTFPASIPVQRGDVLGVSTPAGANGPACQFSLPGESYLSRNPPLADGQQANFGPFSPDSRVNATAVFDPSNTFSLGQLTRNRKKGTAREAVTVPNPGEVTVSGKGVKPARDANARQAVAVSAPGTLEVPIRARGKKRRQLDSAGRVKLSVTVTYSPTGGSPRSQALKVRLREKI